MIRIEKGNIEVRGSVVELMTDLSVIVNSLKQKFSKVFGKEESVDILTNSFNIGILTPEELHEELESTLQNASKEELIDILKGVMKHGK